MKNIFTVALLVLTIESFSFAETHPNKEKSETSRIFVPKKLYFQESQVEKQASFTLLREQELDESENRKFSISSFCLAQGIELTIKNNSAKGVSERIISCTKHLQDRAFQKQPLDSLKLIQELGEPGEFLTEEQLSFILADAIVQNSLLYGRKTKFPQENVKAIGPSYKKRSAELSKNLEQILNSFNKGELTIEGVDKSVATSNLQMAIELLKKKNPIFSGTPFMKLWNSYSSGR